jgi:hypothetical protein
MLLFEYKNNFWLVLLKVYFNLAKGFIIEYFLKIFCCAAIAPSTSQQVTQAPDMEADPPLIIEAENMPQQQTLQMEAEELMMTAFAR